MFFYLSKIVSILFFPFPLFYIIIFIYLIYKKSRFLILIWIFFGMISTEIVASILLRSLEDRFPYVRISGIQEAEATIVLGGLSNPERSIGDWPEFTDGVDRILFAEEIWHSKKTNYIILSGASGRILQNTHPEAMILKKYLKNKIPEDKILIDAISRNTAENAIESIKICKQFNIKKIHLITSAFHLYRAYDTFLKIKNTIYPELIIYPIPTDFRSIRKNYGPEDFFPNEYSLYKTTIAIKEYIGILGYKLKGYL